MSGGAGCCGQSGRVSRAGAQAGRAGACCAADQAGGAGHRGGAGSQGAADRHGVHLPEGGQVVQLWQLAKRGKRKSRQGAPVWCVLPALLSAAVILGGDCAPVLLALAPVCATFHGMPPGYFFTVCRGGTFRRRRRGQILHLTGLRSRCRALT